MKLVMVHMIVIVKRLGALINGVTEILVVLGDWKGVISLIPAERLIDLVFFNNRCCSCKKYTITL